MPSFLHFLLAVVTQLQSWGIIGFMAGFGSAIFAEPLRRRIYRPTLQLGFKDADHYVAETVETKGPEQRKARYVRVRVVNKSAAMAKSCVAYLVDIERLGSSGNWEATTYCESMQLPWSGRGHEAIDVPQGVPLFVDVISTREGSSEFIASMQQRSLLNRYRSIWSTIGTFRFTICVTSDGAEPAAIGLSFKWTGQWDGFTVTKVEPKDRATD